MWLTASLFLAHLAASPALAQSPGSPQCQHDLDRAWRLVNAVAARDRAGPVREPARLCALLRRNLVEMTEAARPMERCMTGHARGENVGHMVASIGDVRAAIARRCG